MFCGSWLALTGVTVTVTGVDAEPWLLGPPGTNARSEIDPVTNSGRDSVNVESPALSERWIVTHCPDAACCCRSTTWSGLTGAMLPVSVTSCP